MLYDLSENKHADYTRVLQIRTVVQNYKNNEFSNEVSMPKGYFKRKKELAIWLKSDQDREVEKNRILKTQKS